MSDGASRHPVLIVMGVSGSGKSTVGLALAERIGAPFIDADDLHPVANKEKMRQGIPLNDDDRMPWLRAVGTAALAAAQQGPAPVVACSVLKLRYRDVLREFVPDALLVYLHGDRELIRERLADRLHEFMPQTLLDSQFDALEVPCPKERSITVPLTGSVAEIVDHVIAAR